MNNIENQVNAVIDILTNPITSCVNKNATMAAATSIEITMQRGKEVSRSWEQKKEKRGKPKSLNCFLLALPLRSIEIKPCFLYPFFLFPPLFLSCCIRFYVIKVNFPLCHCLFQVCIHRLQLVTPIKSDV